MERNLPFTLEHDMFRRTFRYFVDKEIVPNYAKWEEDHMVPRKLFKKMVDHGFLCPWIDEEYGGAGADLLYDFIICEELAKKNR